MGVNYQSVELFDFLEDFDGGVNQTRSPLKLPRNTLAGAVNVTVRNDFARHRPIFVKRAITFSSPAEEAAFKTGLFQGRSFYIPDNGPPGVVVAISGVLYDCVIVGNTITVTQVSGAGTNQDATADQHWLWQAEKWIIWNDGINKPVFFNVNPQNYNGVLDPGGKLCVRSNWGQTIGYNTTTAGAAPFTIPPINTSSSTVFTAIADLNVGSVVTIEGFGMFAVQSIDGITFAVGLLNVNAGPIGKDIDIGAKVTWKNLTGFQLPPGRMGVYGQGRVWMSLIDGKQFVVGDLRGGASGTAPENYRDAVLSITENLYLVGGGTFSVPGPLGSITGMRFIAVINTSLGQGPLQGPDGDQCVFLQRARGPADVAEHDDADPDRGPHHQRRQGPGLDAGFKRRPHVQGHQRPPLAHPGPARLQRLGQHAGQHGGGRRAATGRSRPASVRFLVSVRQPPAADNPFD